MDIPTGFPSYDNAAIHKMGLRCRQTSSDYDCESDLVRGRTDPEDLDLENPPVAKRHVGVRNRIWDVTPSGSSSPFPWQGLVHSILEEEHIWSRRAGTEPDRCRRYPIIVDILPDRQ